MKQQKNKTASGLLGVIEEYSHKIIKEHLRGYIQFFVGVIINLDVNNGRARVRYISENKDNNSSDIQAVIKTQEKIKVGDTVIVIYINNLANSFIIAKLSSDYYIEKQMTGNGSIDILPLLSQYLLKSGGTLSGPLIIAGGVGGGIIFPANGAITYGDTKNTLLASTVNGLTLGNLELPLTLYGASSTLLYNGEPLMTSTDVITKYLPLEGGELKGNLIMPNKGASGIYWQSLEVTPFIGYSSDKEDKSFIVSSIEGTSFENGLAIDGTDKELYWKNQRVATETDLGLKVDKEEGKGLSSNDFTDEYKAQLDNLNNDIQEQVNDLTELIETKQDKKPDGNINLINTETGKIDNAYIPTNLGGGRRFAGTFGSNGIIVASAYANEVNGLNINNISFKDCIGYEFAYTGETPFSLAGLEVNKNDIVVCNGDKTPNWTLYDNSDKVVSVNGQTGAVNVTADTINAVPVKVGDNTITNSNESIVLNAYKDFVYDGTTYENISSSKIEMDGETTTISYNNNSSYGSTSNALVDSSGVHLSYRGGSIPGSRTPASSIDVGGTLALSGDTTITSSHTPVTADPPTSTATVEITPANFKVKTSYTSQGAYLPGEGGETTVTENIREQIFNISSSGVTINNERVLVESDLQSIEPPNLEGYATEEFVTTNINALTSKIIVEKLEGTSSRPINFATSMQAGHLYSCTGTVYRGSSYSNFDLRASTLIYKCYGESGTHQVIIYGAKITPYLYEPSEVGTTSSIETNSSGAWSSFNRWYYGIPNGATTSKLNLSIFNNDVGYITSADIPDMPTTEGLATEEFVNTKIATKADKTELNNYLPLTGGTLTGQLAVDEIKSNTSNAVKIMSNNNTSPQAACLYSNVPGSCTFAMYGGVEGGNGNSLLGGFGIKDKVPVFYDFLTAKELALKTDIESLATTGTVLNATKLNNQDASYYLDYNNFTNKPTIPTGAAANKGVVTSIDTSANLPTSNAVKTFVEGKDYSPKVHTHTKSEISDFEHTHSYFPLSGGYLSEGASLRMTGSNPLVGLLEYDKTQYYLQAYQGEIGMSVGGKWSTARISLDSAGKVTIPSKLLSSGTYNYTLPDKTGTIALTSDLSALASGVTLDTAQTITGAKTFTGTIIVPDISLG